MWFVVIISVIYFSNLLTFFETFPWFFCTVFFFLWSGKCWGCRWNNKKRALNAFGWQNASKEQNLEKHPERRFILQQAQFNLLACFMYQLSVQIISGLWSVNMSESLTLFILCWCTLWNTDVEGEFLDHTRSTECRRRSSTVRCFLWNQEGNPQNAKWQMAAKQKKVSYSLFESKTRTHSLVQLLLRRGCKMTPPSKNLSQHSQRRLW